MAQEIQIEKNVSREKLEESGVFSWPLWEKEVSCFPWHYDETETCYILEGEVQVTSDSGAVHTIGTGDMVVFPKGLGCTWDITKDLRKHYRFG
jgi:uncharacterized cupin superfamily protein